MKNESYRECLSESEKGKVKNDGFRVNFEKFFKKGFILHCKSLILNEASFSDDMCGRNKTKNFLSFLPHMSFVKSSRRPALVPEVLRVSCKTLKSLGEKSLEFLATVLRVMGKSFVSVERPARPHPRL